jgi:hypothetical protein
MKKSTKKFLVILSCCLLSCSAAALTTACDNTGSGIIPGGQQTEKASISFSSEEKAMTIGDEEYLQPNYTKIKGYALSYESSNSSVVSVDEEGKIFYFNFETEHSLSKEGYVQASGIEDVVNYISFLANGAFVPSFTVRAVDENEKVSLEKLQKI